MFRGQGLPPPHLARHLAHPAPAFGLGGWFQVFRASSGVGFWCSELLVRSASRVGFWYLVLLGLVQGLVSGD